MNHNYIVPQAISVSFSIGCQTTQLTRTYTKYPFVPSEDFEIIKRSELILTMQAHALKSRIEHTQAKKVVIGLSVGLDSTLALIVALRAIKLLGRASSDIYGITMPGFGTSKRTYGNVNKLADCTGISFKEIDISTSVSNHLSDIDHPSDARDVTYENAQARKRMQILMDIANQTNGIVIGTGDLSELALGWCTYNGDHMSMYNVNASVPKTLVQYLIKFEAGHVDSSLSKVLFDILDTPISPELLPTEDGVIAQKTENIIGPYALHDFFLYYLIRYSFRPSKVYRLAIRAFDKDYDKELIIASLVTFIKRFFANQFKRNCLPDCVKIGSVSLSPRGDWRMPSDAACHAWLMDLKEYIPEIYQTI
jgi:NAD+ synthase (glutamine-hydrolysing)